MPAVSSTTGTLREAPDRAACPAPRRPRVAACARRSGAASSSTEQTSSSGAGSGTRETSRDGGGRRPSGLKSTARAPAPGNRPPARPGAAANPSTREEETCSRSGFRSRAERASCGLAALRGAACAAAAPAAPPPPRRRLPSPPAPPSSGPAGRTSCCATAAARSPCPALHPPGRGGRRLRRPAVPAAPAARGAARRGRLGGRRSARLSPDAAAERGSATSRWRCAGRPRHGLDGLRPVMAPDFTFSFLGLQGPEAALEAWRGRGFSPLDRVPVLLDRGLSSRAGALWVAPARAPASARLPRPAPGLPRAPREGAGSGCSWSGRRRRDTRGSATCEVREAAGPDRRDSGPRGMGTWRSAPRTQHYPLWLPTFPVFTKSA